MSAEIWQALYHTPFWLSLDEARFNAQKNVDKMLHETALDIPEWATSLIRTGFGVIDEAADVNNDTIKVPVDANEVIVSCTIGPNGKVSTKQYKEYLAKLRENPNYKTPLPHNTERKPKQKNKRFTKARMRNKAWNDEIIHKMRVQQRKELEAEQGLVTAPSLLS